MENIIVKLDTDEKAALEDLAKQDFRTVEQAAAYVIRQELARRGLLKAVTVIAEKNTGENFIKLDE